ncbi:hypothetical protein NDU88_000044 [Pleurodeles waltl]|uniref:Uncharacterized protein n=1 Tax=Pleurodeles waltl TaxID=8319 RepID=A0AAV7WHT7_PLEWA|nr:hypothetical protein NDU88_000044 [Pleurodeles waltl]
MSPGLGAVPSGTRLCLLEHRPCGLCHLVHRHMGGATWNPVVSPGTQAVQVVSSGTQAHGRCHMEPSSVSWNTGRASCVIWYTGTWAVPHGTQQCLLEHRPCKLCHLVHRHMGRAIWNPVGSPGTQAVQVVSSGTQAHGRCHMEPSSVSWNTGRASCVIWYTGTWAVPPGTRRYLLEHRPCRLCHTTWNPAVSPGTQAVRAVSSGTQAHGPCHLEHRLSH